MTEQQCRTLAAEIENHFPHTSTLVVQSSDQRHSPRNFFLAIQRRDGLMEGLSLHIHSMNAWVEFVTAYQVLKP